MGVFPLKSMSRKKSYPNLAVEVVKSSAASSLITSNTFFLEPVNVKSKTPEDSLLTEVKNLLESLTPIFPDHVLVEIRELIKLLRVV